MLEAAIEAPHVRVLIVDDSKLARVKLRKMLEAEDLLVQIDMAESAEEALEYLTRERPEVIFLDHNMPGMSGLAALKIIKANPATATIPIMMYTSESDNVYLGKARALGAFDVLVKEDLKAVRLSKRLRELKLRPRPNLKNKVFDVKVYDGASQRSKVSRIEQRYREDRLRVVNNTAQTTTDGQNNLTPDDSGFYRRPDDFRPVEIIEGELSKSNWWLPLVVFVSAVILAIGLSQYFSPLSTPKVMPVPVKGNPGISISATASDNLDLGVIRNSTVVEPVNGLPNDSDTIQLTPLITALSWAMGQRMEYPFDEQPLAGARLDELRVMLGYLEDANFSGEVNLIVHQGDYCLNQANDGRQHLPEADSSVTNCTVVEARPGDQLLSDLQSVEFARFLTVSPSANGDNGIVVNISSADNDSVLYPYPVAVSGLTAYDWNTVADRNNTIEVVVNRL